MKYYPRKVNKIADKIANDTFTFMSNVSKLYSIVPKWLENHVGVDKPFTFVCITSWMNGKLIMN